MFKNKYFNALISAFFMAVIAVQTVFAAINPEYLKDGRTYDQESAYFKWNGPVSYKSLYHRDNTTLPPSEGGGSCNEGCTESVTRIEDGGSISGNFTYLKSFNIQVAYSGKDDVGTAVGRACGQIFLEVNLYQRGAGTPGFNNFPVPAWNVPTGGDCTWSLTAEGGYVDFRAITTTFLTTPAPTVDLKVNGNDGPFNTLPPANYSLSWATTNAAACTATGNWSGAQSTNGTQAFSNITGGSYTYTLTCTNPSGSASDSVTLNVIGSPTVSINVPNVLTAPASFSATWSSTNAVSCTGSNRFSGLTGVNGARLESNLGAGEYDYTVVCVNAIGEAVSDTKRAIVYATPLVDLKVDGSDGPTITRTGPASFMAIWTSTHATQCTGSARLAGFFGTNGYRTENNLPGGITYVYTMTCLNAAGASASDTITVVVEAPMSGTISGIYSRLLLFAPTLGQPAQSLAGSVSGGIPPFTILARIRTPSGTLITLPRSGSAWSVTPDNSRDPNFGTTEKGIWTAWADLQDSIGQTYRTASVIWEVAWHPVHGRP